MEKQKRVLQASLNSETRRVEPHSDSDPVLSKPVNDNGTFYKCS